MGQSTVGQASRPMSPLTTRALEIADTTDGLAEFVAAVPYPSGPVPVDAKGATDWIIVDAALDPHLAAGTLSMPRHAQRRLERIAATGVRFDALLIGHELAPNTISHLSFEEREALLTRHGGSTKTDATSELQQQVSRLVGPPPPDRAATKAVEIGQALVRWVSGGMAATANTVGALLDGLDPVVFGVAAAKGDPEPGELVALFYLAHWN